MKKTILLLTVIAFTTILTKTASAHCEVPCGIYNDELRIELIKEHIQTIEKAMNQITEIQNSETVNYNQLVRWINTKETHATLIQEITEQYFLAQRVKFALLSDKENYTKYINQLTYLHQLIVFSMKAKQSTDLKYIDDLNKSVTNFEIVYFGKEAHRHDLKGEHK
ncbi:MAG: superoxide dismutase [Bacteroidetes bacterium]|nr:superoxide dismutase [Bacteroidota bacterium]